MTQVVSPNLASSQMHSRATHSQKVALIAREIAEKLAREALRDTSLQAVIRSHGGLDLAACEAAGLAHDLGHPPFGHVGEEVLDDMLREHKVWDGFEGNAQSFRIVTTLARHHAGQELPGHALTAVTLAAIAKYPWDRDLRPEKDAPHGSRHSKFGAYATELDKLRAARDAVIPDNTDRTYRKRKTSKRPRQTLEASIMDIADDIAYSIHDLEDFCAQGTIDLRRVAAEIDRANAMLTSVPLAREAANVFVVAATDLAEKNPEFWDPELYREALYKVAFQFKATADDLLQSDPGLFVARLRDLLSLWVNEFFVALRCDGDQTKPPVYLEPRAWHTMQVLKLVTKRFLVLSAAVGQIQQAQIQAMKRLFEGVVDWLQEASSATVLPVKLQEVLVDQGLGVAKEEPGKALREEHYRAVSDYICTLSDAEAFEISQWLGGHTVPGAMYAD